MWKDILKEDYEYGRRYRKPDGSTFREGMGFRDEELSRFRGSGSEEMPSTDLANWFATVNDNFEELFNQLSGGIEGEGELPEGGPGGGMPYKYREDTGAFKAFKRYSMELAKELTEEMLIAFIDSITEEGYFENDYEMNEENILNSKPYQEVTQAGLKASTEIITAILDTAFITVRKTADRDSYATELIEEDMSPEELFRELPPGQVDDFWQVVGGQINRNIGMAVDNIVDDMFTDSSISIDLDGEGDSKFEMSVVRDKVGAAAKQFIAENDLIKKISGNAIQHFLIIYEPRLERLAEAETQEGEEEMENAPRIDFEDVDDFDDDFREEYKSFDEVENSWQSILKVGGSAAVGMTSNAGFTPAVHNITYGDCGCQKKKSKCGCDD